MSTPDGFHTITPHITVADAKAAIAHYEAALGAVSMGVMEMPGTGKVMHAMLQIGSSRLFLADEVPGMTPPAPANGVGGSSFYLYLDDVDAAHARAVSAGMTEVQAPEDTFWGDRTARLSDPYGHSWTLATQVREVTMDEMTQAMEAMAG